MNLLNSPNYKNLIGWSQNIATLHESQRDIEKYLKATFEVKENELILEISA